MKLTQESIAACAVFAIGLVLPLASFAQASIKSVEPGNFQKCDASRPRCSVKVPVVVDPLDKYGCRIQAVPEGIIVPKSNLAGGAKIWVVWRVDSTVWDDLFYDFRFSQAEGIKFVKAVPSDETEFPPDTLDFDGPGWDDDTSLSPAEKQRRYRWTSVNGNGRNRAFHYQINLEWKPVSEAVWRPCNPADPKIVNTN